MNILVFDIETVPDVASCNKLYKLNDLTAEETVLAAQTLRKAKTGTEFLPHYLHKIIAISLILVQDSQIKLWSLGTLESSEASLIQRFFAGIDKYRPILISWNGTGFDLPVLHYRALMHKVSAANYWEHGENQTEFRYNNYLNRFHYRHLDLMDILASYQAKAFAPLDDIATLLDFPGKMGMQGDKVWHYYQKGSLEAIRNYCETDVLNTYCVYLNFELMRANLSSQTYHQALDTLKDYLKQQSHRLHLKEFLQAMSE